MQCSLKYMYLLQRQAILFHAFWLWLFIIYNLCVSNCEVKHLSHKIIKNKNYIKNWIRRKSTYQKIKLNQLFYKKNSSLYRTYYTELIISTIQKEYIFYYDVDLGIWIVMYIFYIFILLLIDAESGINYFRSYSLFLRNIVNAVWTVNVF